MFELDLLTLKFLPNLIPSLSRSLFDSPAVLMGP